MQEKISFYRYLVFAIGILATIAYRIIVVLNNYDPIWVQIAWYVGTLGFVWYFIHRYHVENKRDRIITDNNLSEKIRQGETLTETERNELANILSRLQSSLSKWNYLAIFILSALALLYGFYHDLILAFF